jgi:hypothetical protein
MASGFSLARSAAKRTFFDRPGVLKAIDARTRRYLGRLGASVRLTARRSIRRRKAVSKPGSPPTDRTGLLKRNIFYSFDPARRSVVIGPVKLNAAGRDVPRLLEEGGRRSGVFYREHARTRDPRTGHFRSNVKERIEGTVEFAPRPYMKPAFDAGLDRADRFWQESLA